MSYLPRTGNTEDNAQFWHRQLQGFDGVCERQWPTLSCERIVTEPDYPPTVSQTLTLKTSLPSLEAIARQSTLSSVDTILRAAFASILSEYLELDRVILGENIVHNRDSAPATSTIPVPIVVAPQARVNDLFWQVDEFISSTTSRGAVPSGLVRDILQCPVSQVPFNAFFIGLFNGTAGKDLYSSQSGPDEPPISLGVDYCGEDSLSCTLSIRGDLIDSVHLELVLQQIDALVTAMACNPTKSIQDLTKLFPSHLLSVYTPSVSEQLKHAPSLSPSYWVDHWAKSNPNWPALEVIRELSEDKIQSQTWTYGQLAQRSNQISTWLIRRGWRKNMIGDVLGDVVPPEGCEIIDIDSPELYAELDNIEETAVVEAEPSDNCYLLYTSGSTGLPKGVLVTRGNLSAFTEAQSEYICRDVPDTLRLGGKGAYLAHASRAFDVHICEMVLGWRHGLRLVTAPRTMLLDNLRLVLTQCRISHAGFVPSLLEHTGLNAAQLPDLRYLGVGGEKISETIIERFVGKPSIALVNAYGPTEVTIGLTSHTVTATSNVRNIGSAVGNITLHVLDPESNDYVKRGQAGELCVTGDLVAKGYYNRPDAKGFTDFQREHMYRTGDIVRLMANNCVEYLGRRDSQAKVRGQRLELEEVSIAVRRCAEHAVNVTSMVTPSPITKRPQLVTFISPASDRPDNATTRPSFMKEEYQNWVPHVLERCRRQLPAYMVPSVLLPVSFIPIQISGKADNRRLVSLYESIPASDLLHDTSIPIVSGPGKSQESDNEPLTVEEQRIADIICSVTSADRHTVTKTTSIFQLGIDSLSSMNLAAQMRKDGYTCSAADVLRSATIEQLAGLPRHNDNAGQSGQGSLSDQQISESMRQLKALDQTVRALHKPILNSSIANVRPCLPLQESLVSNSVDSPTPLYVNHIMFRLGSTTSLQALRLAFEDLVQENETLRTCFHVMDDRVVQVVLKPRVVELAWEQLSVPDEQTAQHYFQECQAEVASKIVSSIERQPPMLITAASSTQNEGSGWLMLSIHHSIFDGASIGILLDRLYDHYTGDTCMNSIDLTPLYGHFMTLKEKEAEDYWSRYLSDCRPGIIIVNDPSDTTYSIITEKVPLRLSALSSLASRISTTAPLVLETLWAIALAKLLRQCDVIFGRVMNGRAIPVDSVETMLVPLVTTVPARLRLSTAAMSLVDLIKTHTRACLETLPYQHTALRAIQRYAQSPGPLFNSMFSYIAKVRSPAGSLLQEMDSVMEADYPLAMEIRADAETETVTLRLRVANDQILTRNAPTVISTMLILLQSLAATGDAIIHEPGLIQEQEPKQTETCDVSEWTKGETQIRKIVSQITGLPEAQIAKHTSFFALGIDSVIAIRLARCLQQDGLKVSSSDILKHASVASLCSHLQETPTARAETQGEKPILDADAKLNLLNADSSIVEYLERLYRGKQTSIAPFAPAARSIANIQEQSAQFWADSVAGYQYQGIPTSPDHSVKSPPQWAEVKVQAPVADLLRQCGSLDVTLQTVALLAYGRSLAVLLGQRDVVFGHVVSGRGLDDDTTGSRIGPLFNTVPFRLTLEPVLQSTRSVLQNIQRFSADALQHQHVSLAEVQKRWRLTSQSPSPSLFDALFTFNKSDNPDPDAVFQPYLGEREPLAAPHYKLNVEFEQSPEFLFIRVACRDVMGGSDELETWLQTLARSLVEIVSFPDAPVLRFPAGLNALPLADTSQQVTEADVVDTPDSVRLVEVIKDILAQVTGTSVEQIGDSISIFALGVDSILAMDISARCRKTQLRLSASDILQGMTVQGIARLAAKRLVASPQSTESTPARAPTLSSEVKEKALATLSLTDNEIEAVLPCLSGQLFYISRWLQSGRRLWEFTFAFKSSVQIDKDRMQHAWHLLQERHSVLRTAFAAVSSTEAVQVVSKSTRAGEVHVEKQQLCSENHDQEFLQQAMQRIESTPSNLMTPPTRLCLVPSPDGVDLILLTLHHALYDAWTLPILIRDLEALYYGVSLPTPENDFPSFVHDAQRIPDPAYWEPALRMAQPTILGSNVFEPQDFSQVKSSHALHPPRETLTNIKSLCHQKGVTMPSLILLTIGRSLARLADVSNPTFGLFHAGRANDSSLADGVHGMTAGPTVNMLPFVVQDALSCSVPAGVEAVQQSLSERAASHEQADLRRLLTQFNESRSQGDVGLQFNVLVNVIVQSTWKKEEDGAERSIFTPIRIDKEERESSVSVEKEVIASAVDALDCNELPCRRNAMLEVHYDEAEDALSWRIDYTPDLMSSSEAEGLLEVLGSEIGEVIGGLS
ncbi:putative nonribosomal peptide synthase [Aspergillus homomorphus CBS 101889]|uniref:Putative nonribosomal peptide synthase n=1 Tax=Aspergillus homomorphus (strain CBS 101889) TaxID=1450537 RepID=A0A395IAY3_ASPHC|nr:putative nonribosomal peptide synthase [Aspergillus homomorphus CBS 101889]RAL17382.1 putative nonribosomal peptide synthase [Aspergillus homomorphus CBS 101889]